MQGVHPLPNPKTSIPNHQSQIIHLNSSIPNHQSQIINQKFSLLLPVFQQTFEHGLPEGALIGDGRVFYLTHQVRL